MSAIWDALEEETADGVSLREERKAARSREGLWVVVSGGQEVGFLTRFGRAPGECHPWKAFRGTGFQAEYLGAFYARDGGKLAAVRAILEGI